MAKKETAEQKLLKIIESQGQQEQAAQAQQAPQTPQSPQAQPQPQASPAPQSQDAAQQVAQAVKGTGLPPLNLPSFLSPLMDLLKGKPPQFPASLSLGLKEINHLLGVIVMVTAVILTINVIKDFKSVKGKVIFEVDQNQKGQMIMALLPIKQISDYLENFKRRNLFQPYEKKKPTEDLIVELQASEIETMTKDLKLVGISWSETPESASAMIENTVSQVTFFLKQGETINDVAIKTIYADRIILTYENEERVLKL
ncbi:MAG: type II secretion system protein N [Candidatus Omnitrophota bacterium]